MSGQKWVAGWNTPGALPEVPYETFDNFEDAVRYLGENVVSFWDEDSENDDKAGEVWLPVHTALHHASAIDGVFYKMAGDGSLVFSIERVES